MNPFGCGDLEVEQVVLGCCVDGGREATAGVIELVPLGAFIHPPFREAYLLLRQMLMDGQHIDLVTFSMAYRKQIGVPPLEVADCWNRVPCCDAGATLGTGPPPFHNPNGVAANLGRAPHGPKAQPR